MPHINVIRRAGVQPPRAPSWSEEGGMLDLIYLALGLVVLCVFGVYAAALRRL